MSDPATYRSKEEVEDMKQNHDPISTLKQYITDNKIASDEECKAIDKEIRDLVKSQKILLKIVKSQALMNYILMFINLLANQLPSKLCFGLL